MARETAAEAAAASDGDQDTAAEDGAPKRARRSRRSAPRKKRETADTAAEPVAETGEGSDDSFPIMTSPVPVVEPVVTQEQPAMTGGRGSGGSAVGGGGNGGDAEPAPAEPIAGESLSDSDDSKEKRRGWWSRLLQ